jgi:glycosyltransferase involved in cell wall biosynthesis
MNCAEVMRILLLRHYPLVEGPSMRAVADQISSGLRGRGYKVQEFTAPVLLGGLLPRSKVATKWLGYVDQFLIFPPWLWLRAVLLPQGSLCVLVDQALGPWLPFLSRRAHVVHCNDLLALEAALGYQNFYRPSRSGRLYQRWIQKGFRQGMCFLSISAATKVALERHLNHPPLLSAVLHLSLSPRFRVLTAEHAAAVVSQALPRIGSHPFLIHIGRYWYKNRLGVLAIWEQLHLLGIPQHLVLVGSADAAMQNWLESRTHLTPFLHILDGASDELVVALYNRAAALLFPSHAEGFGWPILEALACGCPVITTNKPPMTEVGGEAVTTIPPAPSSRDAWELWAQQAALQVNLVLTRCAPEQERIRELGFAQARLFQFEPWLDQLECYYQQALALQEK